jgi:hypothetical protein
MKYSKTILLEAIVRRQVRVHLLVLGKEADVVKRYLSRI